MRRAYAIRKQDESHYWSETLGWTHISAADFYDEEPAPREGGTLTTILIGSTRRPAYDLNELENTIRAVQRHNKYFAGASENELRELIHCHMALLDREEGVYISTAGFVITRYKIEDRVAFKISVSASLFAQWFKKKSCGSFKLSAGKQNKKLRGLALLLIASLPAA